MKTKDYIIGRLIARIKNIPLLAVGDIKDNVEDIVKEAEGLWEEANNNNSYPTKQRN